MKIAIVAALPREIAGLVRGVKADASLVDSGIYLYRLPEAVVVAAGMGAVRASLAVGAALGEGVTGLVSAGLAGGCMPGVNAGAVVEANVVVDVKTGERFPCAVDLADGVDPVVLVTSDGIASVEEKARLHTSYGAALVDMEAATVAGLARANGLEFRAIKGVSDEHDFELISMSRFTGKHGSFRTAAFALHTAMRPGNWKDAVRLGRGSSLALEALTERLRGLVESLL